TLRNSTIVSRGRKSERQGGSRARQTQMESSTRWKSSTAREAECDGEGALYGRG
ncbi:unnamed protein product, partial [Nesidiocoris tenuis]